MESKLKGEADDEDGWDIISRGEWFVVGIRAFIDKCSSCQERVTHEPHSLVGYINGARHVEAAFRRIRFILLLWSLLHRSAIDNYMTQSLALSMLTKLHSAS